MADAGGGKSEVLTIRHLNAYEVTSGSRSSIRVVSTIACKPAGHRPSASVHDPSLARDLDHACQNLIKIGSSLGAGHPIECSFDALSAAERRRHPAPARRAHGWIVVFASSSNASTPEGGLPPMGSVPVKVDLRELPSPVVESDSEDASMAASAKAPADSSIILVGLLLPVSQKDQPMIDQSSPLEEDWSPTDSSGWRERLQVVARNASSAFYETLLAGSDLHLAIAAAGAAISAAAAMGRVVGA
jgi:hypothetical protein